MKRKIIVRRSKNIEAMRAIEARCFPSDEPVDDTKKSSWWIAYLDGEPVGFAVSEDYTKEITYLSRSGVLAKAAGLGIQKRLIKAREQHAKRQGKTLVITYTLIDNPKSVNSLIAKGYRLYQPQYAWVGRKVLYWQKKVNNVN